MTVEQQLKAIRKTVRILYREQSDCFRQLESEMAEQGILRLTNDMLTGMQSEYVANFVANEVVSVATPIAIDSEETFPLLSGARVCLCLRMESQSGSSLSNSDESEDHFVVVPLGKSLDRIVPIPCDSNTEFHYMFLEDAIELHFPKLLGETNVLESAVFRITRNGDIRVNQDEAADLLQGYATVAGRADVERLCSIGIGKLGIG